MSKPEQKARRLFKNGNRWWLRMTTSVPGEYKRISTGTAELKIANRIAHMVESFQAERTHRDLLAHVTAGRATLMQLYDAHATGTLDALRSDITRAERVDPDIEPFVSRWENEHLRGRSIAPATVLDYVRQVRELVPAGKTFPASRWTEETIKAALLNLEVSDSTKRRYAAAWQLFSRYVRRRVGVTVADPFEYQKEWMPKNGTSRTTFWTHRQARTVLDYTDGLRRSALALMFGTGMELAAIRNLQYDHLIGERTLVAPGTKNAHRRDRTIICDAWAWTIFKGSLGMYKHGFPGGRIFSEMTDNELRNAFYDAQVAAGIINEPPRSSNGKKLWAVVKPHRLHDARHTYAITRLLGTDGEPQRTMKFISHQLGHADETMLSRVYAKANVEARHDLALAEIAMDEKVTLEIAK